MWGKIVSLCFLITLFAQTHAVYEDKILEMLEDVRRRMCYNDPEGLPQLEPFILEDEIPFDIDSPDIGKLSGYVRNVRVDGLSEFLVNSLNFAITLKFGFSIAVPKLVLTADYALKGNLAGLIDLDGKGKLSVTIGGLGLAANGALVYATGQGMSLKNLELLPTLEKLDALIGGLTQDQEINEFFDDAISELAPKFINQLPEETRHSLEKMVEDFATDYLKDFTASDILALINGNGDPLFPNELNEEKACPARPAAENDKEFQIVPEVLPV